MAKVEYGALVTALKGSIGGWTFQSNRSGNIVRLRSGPFRAVTNKQTLAHQSLIQFLQLWQQLSSVNKTQWNIYATTWTKTDRFGTVNTLSGLNWFQSINYYRDLLSLSILNTPPVHTLPIDVQSYSLIVDATKIEIEFNPVFNPTDNALLIFSSSFSTRVTTSQRQYMRLTNVINSGPYGVIDITSEWEATHQISWPPSAAPICGRIGVQIQTINVNSGISSTALSTTSATTTGAVGIGSMIIGSTFMVN